MPPGAPGDGPRSTIEHTRQVAKHHDLVLAVPSTRSRVLGFPALSMLVDALRSSRGSQRRHTTGRSEPNCLRLVVSDLMQFSEHPLVRLTADRMPRRLACKIRGRCGEAG
jgi:hypothetical protein